MASYDGQFRGFQDFVASTAITVGQAVPAGSLVVATVQHYKSTQTLTGITDTKTNTWTPADTVASGSTGVGTVPACSIAWSFITTPLTTADTITPATSSADGVAAIFGVYSGVTAFDKHAGQLVAFDTAQTSGNTPATAQASELLVGVHTYFGQAITWTPDSPWQQAGTSYFPITDYVLIHQYRIVSVAGPYASSGVTGSPLTGWNGIVTFGASPAGVNVPVSRHALGAGRW